MKKTNLFLISILFIFLLNGCVENQIDLKPRINDSHVKIENSSLYEWLKLEKINYYKRKDGLLIVELKFNNISNFNKSLAYKIDWIDKNGFIEKSILSRWIVTKVEQKRSFIIHGIAPSTKIKDFEIKLQMPSHDDNHRKDSYHNEYQN